MDPRIRSESSGGPTPASPYPPGSWWRARRFARRALAPAEAFLAVEASSGILLLAAAVVALVWANSPWRASYTALWTAKITIGFASWSFEHDLRFWINEGVMTIFFFVVGLEIRREIHRGALSELRRAALPLAGALGGMVVPACIFFALNHGRVSAEGWGIPMATDIAFAVGVLTLLGRRVPEGLRVLLLALAVIDDVGAIVVIAVFYSSGLEAQGFAIAGLGIALILGMQLLGVRTPWAYVVPAFVVWGGAYTAGIHPTLAGVLVGLLTPVRAWFGPQVFIDRVDQSAAALREHEPGDEREVLEHLAYLDQARREAVSPVERIEHALHGWVANGIMPLFALANAGVYLGDVSMGGASTFVLAGTILGLVVGKPVGVVGAAWLVERLGWATLPDGVSWRGMIVVGVVAGVGFTMAIFIAQLAFPASELLDMAKGGVLLASAVAAVLAYVLGRKVLPAPVRTT